MIEPRQSRADYELVGEINGCVLVDCALSNLELSRYEDNALDAEAKEASGFERL